MKRTLFGSIGLVAGVLLTLGIFSIAGADPPPDSRPPAPKPAIAPGGSITWSTPAVSLTLTAGATYTATVSFTSTNTITDVTTLVAARGPLQVTAIPASLAEVRANVETGLQIVVSVPSQLKPGRYNSTLFLRAGRQVLRHGLPVIVTLPREPVVVPRIVWSTPVISQTLSPGTTFTATVSFTSTRTITDATVAIAPNGPLRVTVVPASLAQVQANTPPSLQVVVSVPPQARPARYGATVYLRVGRQMLRDPLRLVVTLPRETVNVPRIVWSTPVISQTLSPGATYTATLTFTSTRPITDATARIAPNGPLQVTATPSSFAEVQANTPTNLQVVVSVPSQIRPGRYGAMVYIRVGERLLQYGLGIHITIPRSTTAPERSTDPPQRR